MTQRSSPVGEAGETCTQVRLAQCELVAIDRCSCGALRVHLGALTLRVSPEALTQVARTLEQALLVLVNAGMHETSSPLLATAVGRARKTPRGQS
jgi:hypothetical protein